MNQVEDAARKSGLAMSETGGRDAGTRFLPVLSTQYFTGLLSLGSERQSLHCYPERGVTKGRLMETRHHLVPGGFLALEQLGESVLLHRVACPRGH